MKLSAIDKGFSLIEVVISLFILSVSVITIYNLIISTAVSSYDLEQRYLAKEVANNRISLINTLEKSTRPIKRSGEMVMGGQQWQWNEIINFCPPNFVIVLLLLLKIGAGHLKLALFKEDIKSEKKGRSADLTLFS